MEREHILFVWRTLFRCHGWWLENRKERRGVKSAGPSYYQPLVSDLSLDKHQEQIEEKIWSVA